MFRCEAIKENRRKEMTKLAGKVGAWILEVKEFDMGVLAAGRFPRRVWDMMLKKEKEGKATRQPGERNESWRARVQAACSFFGEAMEQIRKEKGAYGWYFKTGVPCDVCGEQGQCYTNEDGSEVCIKCLEKEQMEAEAWEGCTRCGRLGPTGLCESCAMWERAQQEGQEVSGDGGAEELAVLAHRYKADSEWGQEEKDMQCWICGVYTAGDAFCDDCRPIVEGIDEVQQRTVTHDKSRLEKGGGYEEKGGGKVGHAQGGKGQEQSNKRRRELTEEDRAMQQAIDESKRTEAAKWREALPHWNKLKERVEKAGLKIVDVRGDGSCFFHAIERQAEKMGERITHRILRERVCVFFWEHKSNLKDFVAGDWDTFMQKLQRDSYAEDVVIRAAASVLRAKIEVYSSIESYVRPKSLGPLVGQPEQGRVFRVGQLDIPGREHFVSLEAE